MKSRHSKSLGESGCDASVQAAKPSKWVQGASALIVPDESVFGMSHSSFVRRRKEDKGIDEYQHSKEFHLDAGHVQVKFSIARFMTSLSTTSQVKIIVI